MNLRMTALVTAHITSWTATWTIRCRRGGRTLLELPLVPLCVRWCLWSVVAIISALRLKQSTTRSTGLAGISSPEPLTVTRLLVLPCPRGGGLSCGVAGRDWGGDEGRYPVSVNEEPAGVAIIPTCAT